MNLTNNSIPSIDKAYAMIEEAEKLNPGPWINHSIHVAIAAKLIADKVNFLDPELAYILGLLHDIGRREGKTGMRHGLDGFNYAMSLGYERVADICLSHTALEYDGQIVIVGKWDGTQNEYTSAISYLKTRKDTAYDKLIKLCDYLAMPNGFCLIEKRLVDIGMRGGINEHTIPRWQSTFQIKSYFESLIGTSVYNLLPDVMENTFE